MLASLLPGLREIRAPLVSGYLWLVFFFLALHDQLPSEDDSDSVLQPLFSLGADLSTLGIATVSGVAAYLVGSAVQEMLKLLGRILAPQAPLYGEAGSRISAAGRRDIGETVRIRVQGIARRLHQVALSPGDKGIDEPTPVTVERELPLVRTLLLGERRELVGEVDRLQAEADLRITVAFPLAALAVFLAAEVSLGWLALALPAVLLVVQGYQRQLEAGDLLAKALRIGKADAPALEALATAADEALQRAELEGDLRKSMDGGDGMAAFRLGNLQASSGAFEAAVVSLEFAAEQGIVRAYAEIGLVHEACDDLKRAERAYRDGSERRDEKASRLLAAFLTGLDREEEARETQKELREREVMPPDEVPPRQSKQERESSQEAAYRERMRAGDGKAAINLGLLLERQGDHKGAVEAFQAAIEIDRDDPQAWIRLGRGERAVGRYAAAADAFAHALGLQRSELGPEHLTVAQTLGNLGQMAFLRGRFRDSKELHTEEREIKEKHLGADDSAVADTFADLTAAMRALGETEGALELDRRALAIKEKVSGPNGLSVVGALGNLSNTYMKLAQYEKAREHRERALEISERELGPHNEHVIISLVRLGDCHYELGAYNEAREVEERALAALDATPSADRFLPADAMHLLGSAFEALGDFDRARVEFEKALGRRQELFPPGHPDVAESLNAVGNAIFRLGDHDRALATHRQALEIADSGEAPSRLLRAAILRSLARAQRAFHMLSDSEESLRRAVEADRANPVRDHPSLALTLREYALTLFAVGDSGGALAAVEEAARIQRKKLGDDHPELATTLDAAAVILDGLNRAGPAEDARARAAGIRRERGLE